MVSSRGASVSARLTTSRRAVRSVTVTDVELSNDLRIARVFVTALGTDAETKDVFAGLSKASGFVRSELGRRLTLRYLPEVVFVKDVSGQRGDRILQLLDELHDKTDVASQGSADDVSKR